MPCFFFEGQSPFCRKGAISIENNEVSTWGRKSARLKTSLDVFKTRKLLELARVSALLRNAVTRHSEVADSAADPVRLRVSRRAALVALVGSGWENEWSRVVQFACNACSWGSKRLSS